MAGTSAGSVEWQQKGAVVLRALVVVACYLIVFAGLLYSVGGRVTP